jgi:hypothetical protein
VAEAGLFGGFTSEGSYLRGSDQLCKPVSSTLAIPSCEKKTTAQLAALTLHKGEEQSGSNSKVSAKKSASKIKLMDGEGTLLFTWDSGQVLSGIGSVFLHRKGTWVAIEFTTRFGGRQVEDLVVVRLNNAIGGTAAATPTPTPTPTTPTAPTAPVAKDPPAFTKAMKAGAKWSKRRKHAKAITAYEQALKEIPEHPEALYRLARSHMGNKDKRKTLEVLARIPKSSHGEARIWRVEARFDLVFKSLRADTDFRKAVGIDRGPDDKPTLYERLVAYGGRWEQEPIPCEQPQVNLDLRRNKKRRFDLVIRSKCQGIKETTRLDGSWADKGNAHLGLTFPNTDSADEDLVCKMELCADDTGEDCLRCQLEPDIEFLLRVVRR